MALGPFFSDSGHFGIRFADIFTGVGQVQIIRVGLMLRGMMGMGLP